MPDAAKEFRNRKIANKKIILKKFEIGGLIIAAILVLLSLYLAVSLFIGKGPKAIEGQKTVFYVESGASAAKIAKNLKQEHLIRSPFAFRTMTIILGAGKKIKPGEYEIPSKASPLKILKIITRGDVINHKVTIPEGFTNGMAFERLSANELLVGDLPNMPKEGYLSPDTYQIKRGDTRAAIVEKMINSQSQILDELWLGRAANLPIKSKEEALILASIVEKETGIASERPKVAAVFINRLREGMKLQSDPTIIYGITKGLPIGRKILKSEINRDHPWNTYVIQGLPPTPICNPGKDAIKAVLNPPNTKDLFFVADGTGGHVFAETYAEHERNVAKWRNIRAQKEAMEKDAETSLEGGNK